MIDAHITPELIMNGLRLLLESYRAFRDRFKDKKTPEKVEEILSDAEKVPEKAAAIERSISDTLEPSDAAIVKGDLERLSLLLLPTPKMDAFDYWGQLSKLVTGLHAYAVKQRLFELRGRNDSRLGEVLMLPRSGRCMLPDEHAIHVAVPAGPRQGVKDATTLALLRKNARDFQIMAVIMADFNEYHSTGGPPSVISATSYFSIVPGQQRHWLCFHNDGSSYQFRQEYEYMLNASDLVSIVEALKDDIQEIAKQVDADEQKVAPLLHAIDAFSKKMSE